MLNQQVYLGSVQVSSRFNNKLVGPGERITGAKETQDRLTNVFDAYAEFNRMSPKKQRKWAEILEKAGLIKPGDYTYSDLEKMWQDAVDQAARIYSDTNGSRKVTPWQIAGLSAQLGGVGASGAAGGGSQTSTTIATKTEARDLLAQTYQQEVGRDPDEKELAAFRKALNAAERSNPTKTTTDAKGNTVSTGGVDEQQMAEDFAMQNPEYAETQAATTYFNALQRALGPTASVGSR